MKLKITMIIGILCAANALANETPEFCYNQAISFAKPDDFPVMASSRFDAMLRFWDKSDANKDCVIDEEEFIAVQRGQFQEFDLNHDGKLTQKEWAEKK